MFPTQPRTLALVPARSGSKRLPDKNRADFSGAPLVSWSVNFAVQSGMFGEVAVSTDSPEISSIAEEFGALALPPRPPELSSDSATTSSVILYELQMLQDLRGFNYDVVVVLQPTSPIRRFRDLDLVLGRTYSDSTIDGVVSVAETHLHPRHLKRLVGGQLHPYFDPNVWRLEGKMQPEAYAPTGSYFALKCPAFLKNPEIYRLRLGYVITPTYCNLDIDTAHDFQVAESIFEDLRFKDVFR